MSEFAKYEALKAAGHTAMRVYAIAKEEGVDPITRIRLIRSVFSLNLVEAKKISSEVDEGRSLDARQASLIPAVEEAAKASGDDP